MKLYLAKKDETTLFSFFKQLVIRKKSYGDTYNYINPWYAAMDDFIEQTGWEAKPSRKIRKKSNVVRIEPRQPEMRL